jgi:hypothetical protein
LRESFERIEGMNEVCRLMNLNDKTSDTTHKTAHPAYPVTEPNETNAPADTTSTPWIRKFLTSFEDITNP